MSNDRVNVLDRDTITVASRLMIPAYAVFFAVVGSNFLLAPEHRLAATPGLQYAAVTGGIRLYGCLFLLVAAIITGALVSRRREPCLYALYVAAISMFLWAILQFVAVFFSAASPSGWCWPGLICTACIASSRSLRRREV